MCLQLPTVTEDHASFKQQQDVKLSDLRSNKVIHSGVLSESSLSWSGRVGQGLRLHPLDGQ